MTKTRSQKPGSDSHSHRQLPWFLRVRNKLAFKNTNPTSRVNFIKFGKMTAPALDHLILLAPSPASESLPIATSLFISLGFTVLQGGTHKDGLTSKILIVLEDGIYIEIISFEEQTTEEGKEKKNNHWWGSKAPGWIDFCLLGTPSQDEKVKDLYNPGVKGGRQTKDGKELKWEVTFPKLGDGERRGAIPFFCQDIDGTKREWRGE